MYVFCRLGRLCNLILHSSHARRFVTFPPTFHQFSPGNFIYNTYIPASGHPPISNHDILATLIFKYTCSSNIYVCTLRCRLPDNATVTAAVVSFSNQPWRGKSLHFPDAFQFIIYFIFWPGRQFGAQGLRLRVG